jgi:hypothetical protein
MALTDGPPGAIRGGFHFAAGETMVQKEPRLLLLKRSGLPRLTALRRFEDCGRLGENNLATNAAGREAVSQGQFVHLNGGKAPRRTLGPSRASSSAWPPIRRQVIEGRRLECSHSNCGMLIGGFRGGQIPKPSRAEAIRRLVQIALTARRL